MTGLALYISILLPMLLALTAYAAARRSTAAAAYLSAVALIPLLMISSFSLFGGGHYLGSVGGGLWSIFSLYLTPYNAAYVFTVSVVGILVAVFSAPYMEHRAEELGVKNTTFYLTYGFFLGGLAGAFMAQNLFGIYIFIEVALIASLFQVLYYGYGDRVRITVMYLVWSHVAALLMLAGFIVLYLYGVTSVPLTAAAARALSAPVLYTALLLVLLGSFIKMAALGVHMWLPYVHAEAPTPLSALLSPVLVGFGGYVISVVALPLMPAKWLYALTWYGIATAIYGGMMAYTQRDIKRLFAYSTVSQMGYMILALSLHNIYGLTAAALIYLSHGLGKAVLFMTAGYFIMHLGTRDIDRMGGLYGYNSALAGAAIIGFLNLAGILTIGMISEITLAVALTKAYLGIEYIEIYIAFAAMLVVTGIYAFSTIRSVFFGPQRIAGAGPFDGALAAIVAAAFLSVLLLLPPMSSSIWGNISIYVQNHLLAVRL
ncbi:complex I subunit 5 family protein [Thermoproteus tenax]|uniref:NADH dehydrogenase I chain M n=1 Tax=Thermoproteus tenax (strain ATCC 35583 / DSM 2078 / JCM 9277 / NBRC 100435 / Kra 1) TaxID=768679 RepID=G4RNT2_THETK|nr:complex I subunit 5 family protein [Thermoproteus tenax]CCC81226.1 NADH dehydrogenase I chain M [Thermoproteus tenax Kra 1]